MLLQLAVHHFRGIRRLEIDDFRRLNILHGDNAAGLTALLEAAFLASGPANPQLPLKINHFRSLQHINPHFWRLFFHNLDPTHPVGILAAFSEPLEKRQLTIRSLSSGGPPETESAADEAEAPPAGSPAANLNGLELQLEFARGRSAETETLTTNVRTVQNRIQVAPPPQTYSETRRASFLTAQVLPRDLSGRFQAVQVSKKVRRIVEGLKALYPELNDVMPATGGLLHADAEMPMLVPTQALGHGFQRALSFLLGAAQGPGTLTLMDDVESGISGPRLRPFWREIDLLSRETGTQVIAATHSWSALREASAALASAPGAADDARVYLVRRGAEGPCVLPANIHELPSDPET